MCVLGQKGTFMRLALLWLAISGPIGLDCQPEHHSPIEVRLIAPNPNVCINQGHVDLEAVLTNSGDQEVEISPEGVAHIFAAQKFEGDKETGASGGLRHIEYRKWLRISPHQTAFVPFFAQAGDQFGLSNLLDSSGTIELHIGFQVSPRDNSKSGSLGGTVYSNSVLLRVRKCAG